MKLIEAPRVVAPEGLEMFQDLFDQVRPYSMVYPASFACTARLALFCIDEGIPGDFVETGVWRGGLVALLAGIIKELEPNGGRVVHAFDSFQGLPCASAEDGERAVTSSHIADMDNYRTPVDFIEEIVANTGTEDYVRIYPGWFEDTIVHSVIEDRPGIALLRIDCDFYRSVKDSLRFFSYVPQGGFVFFDDYYWFDGAAKAAHEVLASYPFGRLYTVSTPERPPTQPFASKDRLIPEAAFIRKLGRHAGDNIEYLPASTQLYTP
jgi:hypothetical protein